MTFLILPELKEMENKLSKYSKSTCSENLRKARKLILDEITNIINNNSDSVSTSNQ
jgi:hypothetical protein